MCAGIARAVEGAELDVLQRMLDLDVLCKVDLITYEPHTFAWTDTQYAYHGHRLLWRHLFAGSTHAADWNTTKNARRSRKLERSRLPSAVRSGFFFALCARSERLGTSRLRFFATRQFRDLITFFGRHHPGAMPTREQAIKDRGGCATRFSSRDDETYLNIADAKLGVWTL